MNGKEPNDTVQLSCYHHDNIITMYRGTISSFEQMVARKD